MLKYDSELTNLFRDGKLPSGFYYFTNNINYQIYPVEHNQIGSYRGSKGIYVVDKLPEYGEWSKCQKELTTLRKQLKKVKDNLSRLLKSLS